MWSGPLIYNNNLDLKTKSYNLKVVVGILCLLFNLSSALAKTNHDVNMVL